MARYRMRALIAASSVGLLIGASAGAAYLGGRLAQDATTRHQAARLMQMAEVNGGDITPSAALGVRPLNGTALAVAARYAPLPQAQSDLRAAGDVQQNAPIVQAALEAPSAPPVIRAAAAFAFKAHSQTDSDCLTQAVYYEARGEGTDGMRAVAQVILNRVRHPAFPKTICGVVYQGGYQRTGCQFSFVCNGAMAGPVEAWAWRRAKDIASAALNGYVMKAVGTATHFHTLNVDPVWAGNMIQVATVGGHIFYQFRGRGGHIDNDADGVSPSGAIPAMQANIVTPADGGPAPATQAQTTQPAPAAPAANALPASEIKTAQLVTVLSRIDDAPRAIPMSAKLTGKPAEEVVATLTQTAPAPAPTVQAPAQPAPAAPPAKPAPTIAPILLAKPLR
jgi:spore germination cell wall hydrolase CwlJ-like protein